MSTDDLLDRARQLAYDYGNLVEADVLWDLIELALRLMGERDAARFELDGARAVARKDNEFLLSVRDAAWAERDAARGKLDQVRAAIDEARRRDDGDEAALRETLAAILDDKDLTSH